MFLSNVIIDGLHVKKMKNNIHKKETWEDKFDRKYACWVKNNRKAWRFWKKRTRRLFRKRKIEGI